MLSITRLSLAEAREVLAGASDHAEHIGVPMCISVVDESGNLIAFERMDGAKILSVSLSEDKACTAALARRPTHIYNALAQSGGLVHGIDGSLGGRFSLVGGGYPVIVDGDVVGGVGCSSGTPEQDMECCRAGLERLLGDEADFE